MQKGNHPSSYSFSSAHPNGELLFLHGRFGKPEIWHPLLRSFEASNYLELSAYSCSLRELVKAVSEHIENHNRGLILVGHDFGSPVAQFVALDLEKRLPHLISGLILINSCNLSGFEVPHWRWQALKRLKRLLKSSTRDEVQRLGCFSQSSLLKLAKSWPTEEELREIRKSMCEFEKPILLLWGSRDEMNPPSNAHEIMLSYPDVELFQHDGAGHWPWLDDLDWVSNKIREFSFRARVHAEKSAS